MLSISRSVALIGLAACLLAPISRADGATTFSTQISAHDRSAIGMGRMTAAEIATLDALIQRDIAAARAGNTTAFAKTFIERLTPDERQRAGIDRLTTPERDQLDVLAASAIANRPGVTEIVEHPAAAAATAPSIDHLASYRRSPEIHGEVSVFVGAGSGGRSWYGGSFETEITDPSHHLTVAVGVSEIKGHGLRPCYGDPFYYDPFW